MKRFLHGAYTLLGGGLLMSFLPPFFVYTRLSGRYGNHLKERLGYVPVALATKLLGAPRIWIHAVSLGEVKVADSIIKALRRIIPGCSVILSTTTEHGRALARQTFGNDVPLVYAPIDFVASVRRALSRVRPDILVFLETEIWPAWLAECRRMGIKTALINGRISERSVKGYLKFRPFFREILRDVDAFSMILKDDADRIRAMGADPGKIEANGNAKYDLLVSLVDPAKELEIRHILNLKKQDRVFIAGSTREGEEALVLDAYEKILKEFPDTFEKRGLRYQRWCELFRREVKRNAPVIIVDTYGELFNLYSVGTIVFCGASLVPLGGQNPLEAAVWGKVVFYGPSMENFLDAKALLEKAGAGIPVSSPMTLAEQAIWFLRHPDALKRYGAKARQAVMTNKGAAQKHAEVIRKLLFSDNGVRAHGTLSFFPTRNHSETF